MNGWGVRVGSLISKREDEWYEYDMLGIFDLDFLMKDNAIMLSNMEFHAKIKCIGISKYGIYFLDLLDLKK